jgi:hypothetical protein
MEVSCKMRDNKSHREGKSDGVTIGRSLNGVREGSLGLCFAFVERCSLRELVSLLVVGSDSVYGLLACLIP